LWSWATEISKLSRICNLQFVPEISKLPRCRTLWSWANIYTNQRSLWPCWVCR
jgi:hypothetical protein